MGQDEDRLRLLDAARGLMARGGDKFSITSVCAEAGVERSVFKAHFAGKAALIAALLNPFPEPDKKVSELPKEDPKAAQEPGVSTPDAWLERRLRVFERALNVLETKQEAMAREHAVAIAELEDKLTRFGMRREEMRARLTAEAMTPVVPEAPVEAADEPAPSKPIAEKLVIAPQPIVIVPKNEMADVLQTARAKVRPLEEDIAPDRNARLRWLAIGALSLVAIFLCAGLTFGKGDAAQAVALRGEGETHRQVAANPLEARADAGDAPAQLKLALAYLKGDGVAADKQAAARWSASAAEGGNPVAQYLLGALSDDKARSFQLFSQAAEQGNLKAMHNLAIAYAQGLGTAKDEAKAADWFARAASHGYVDSAFDLAVLYERGAGVPQDLRQALKWYAVAAFTGDKPSQERVAFLRGQLKPDEVKLAMNAAGSFAPLPKVDAAN